MCSYQLFQTCGWFSRSHQERAVYKFESWSVEVLAHSSSDQTIADPCQLHHPYLLQPCLLYDGPVQLLRSEGLLLHTLVRFPSWNAWGTDRVVLLMSPRSWEWCQCASEASLDHAMSLTQIKGRGDTHWRVMEGGTRIQESHTKYNVKIVLSGNTSDAYL